MPGLLDAGESRGIRQIKVPTLKGSKYGKERTLSFYAGNFC